MNQSIKFKRINFISDILCGLLLLAVILSNGGARKDGCRKSTK